MKCDVCGIDFPEKEIVRFKPCGKRVESVLCIKCDRKDELSYEKELPLEARDCVAEIKRNHTRYDRGLSLNTSLSRRRM